MNELDEDLLGLLEGPSTSTKTSRNNTSATSRKPASKPKSKKRRRKNANSSDEEDDDEDTDFDQVSSGLSDLSSNEADSDSEFEREQLEAMELDASELVGLNEFERETKLSELAERKQQLLEKLAIKRRLKASTGKKAQSQRSKNKTRLEELKAKRAKKLRKSADGNDVDDERHRRMFGGDASEDEEDYADRIRSTYSRDSTKHKQALALEDLHGIQISRDLLAKWMFAPFFEDAIIGCFVRLGIGMGSDKQMAYRVCQIVAVEEYHRLYKVNGTQTKKALVLAHGKARKTFLMDIISNQPFTEMEFQRWMRTLESEKVRIPSFSEVSRLKTALDQAKEHVFSNKDIDYMIKEKQRLVPVAKNLAMERLQLLAKKDEAEAEGRHEDLRNLQEDLATIDTLVQSHVASSAGNGRNDELSKAERWTQLNQRNRKRNMEESRQAEIMHRKQKEEMKKHGQVHDPFARIKAVPSQNLSIVSTGPKSGEGSANGSGEVTPSGSASNPLSPALDGGVVASRRTSFKGAGDAINEAFNSVDLDI